MQEKVEVLINLIRFKVAQNRQGNYDLMYKLNPEEVQDMIECRIDGKVPKSFLEIKLI